MGKNGGKWRWCRWFFSRNNFLIFPLSCPFLFLLFPFPAFLFSQLFPLPASEPAGPAGKGSGRIGMKNKKLGGKGGKWRWFLERVFKGHLVQALPWAGTSWTGSDRSDPHPTSPWMFPVHVKATVTSLKSSHQPDIKPVIFLKETVKCKRSLFRGLIFIFFLRIPYLTWFFTYILL